MNEENDAKYQLGRNYIAYAEIYKHRDDISRAKSKMFQAMEIFKECGADGWVEKTEKDRALLN